MARKKRFCIRTYRVHPINGYDAFYENVDTRTRFGAFMIALGRQIAQLKGGSPGVIREGSCKFTGFRTDHPNETP